MRYIGTISFMIVIIECPLILAYNSITKNEPPSLNRPNGQKAR